LTLGCARIGRTEKRQCPQDTLPAATRTHIRVANRVDDKSKRRPCIQSLCRCCSVPTQSPSNPRGSQLTPALRGPHLQRKPHPKRSARELLAERAGSRLIKRALIIHVSTGNEIPAAIAGIAGVPLPGAASSIAGRVVQIAVEGQTLRPRPIVRKRRRWSRRIDIGRIRRRRRYHRRAALRGNCAAKEAEETTHRKRCIGFMTLLTGSDRHHLDRLPMVLCGPELPKAVSRRLLPDGNPGEALAPRRPAKGQSKQPTAALASLWRAPKRCRNPYTCWEPDRGRRAHSRFAARHTRNSGTGRPNGAGNHHRPTTDNRRPNSVPNRRAGGRMFVEC
jgi:hypothetical protein